VREARERLSREYDNDPKRLVEYLMRIQERHADRLLKAAGQQGDAADDASRRS